MTDEIRSRTMRAVRSSNTKPELFVRKLVHSLGYRFRLHRKDLPGTPDLVFPGRKKVIFVHGCFWHGHSCARGSRKPKTNSDYWSAKIARNVARDIKMIDELQCLKWRIETIWECELRDSSGVRDRLMQFLG